MLNNKVTVILVKALWCNHCKDFEPIYLLSKSNYTKNKYLKNFDIEYEIYDMADVNGIDKNKFMLNHYNAQDKITGYPTVIINYNNKYLTTEHTIFNEELGSNTDKLMQDAVERFLENISNTLKSFNSENKVLYMQAGGSNDILQKTSIEEELYRKKYLKYKSKYLKLKL